MVAIHRKVKEEIEDRKANIKFRVQADYNTDPRPTILSKLTGLPASGSKASSANSIMGPRDDYTMLVVGTRGMSNMESMMMGSVSIFLLNHSPIPVVVVRSVARRKGSDGTDQRAAGGSNGKVGSVARLGSIVEGGKNGAGERPSKVGSLHDAPIRMSSLDGGSIAFTSLQKKNTSK